MRRFKTGTVGTHLIAQVGFIVRDVEESKKKWATFLGVDVPETLPGILASW